MIYNPQSFTGRPVVVWNYAKSRKVPYVSCVDDEKNTYDTIPQPMRVANGDVVRQKHYCKKIAVFVWGLVVLDPPPGFDYDLAKQLYHLACQ